MYSASILWRDPLIRTPASGEAPGTIVYRTLLYVNSLPIEAFGGSADKGKFFGS